MSIVQEDPKIRPIARRSFVWTAGANREALIRLLRTDCGKNERVRDNARIVSKSGHNFPGSLTKDSHCQTLFNQLGWWIWIISCTLYIYRSMRLLRRSSQRGNSLEVLLYRISYPQIVSEVPVLPCHFLMPMYLKYKCLYILCRV